MKLTLEQIQKIAAETLSQHPHTQGNVDKIVKDTLMESTTK
jgi:hypothetical protein